MHRWTEVSDDPNSAAAMRARRESLRRAWAEPVADRVRYLESLVAGKRVLDVGVVDHTMESGQPLHRRLAAAASYCVGIDVLESAVRSLREAGYNVRVGDVTREDFDLGERFDVVVCGEVIEHLGNPAAMVRGAWRVLSPGGRLVMTTPNPYYLNRVREHLGGRVSESVDHVTLWFPSGVSELVEREGLVLDRYRGARMPRGARWRGRLFAWLNRLIPRRWLAAEAECNTMIYEIVRPGT